MNTSVAVTYSVKKNSLSAITHTAANKRGTSNDGRSLARRSNSAIATTQRPTTPYSAAILNDCQTLHRTKGLRVQIRVPEDQHMHGGGPCQHKHQNRDRGKARRTCVPLPLLARRQHRQQTQDCQIARRQPEVDAFVNRVDGDVIRHADVRPACAKSPASPRPGTRRPG